MGRGLLEKVDRSTKLAGFNRLALLLFRLDERQIFGINVLKVQEVIQVPELTRMPGTHPHICGVADVRGAVIPVIDMSLALGRGADEKAAHVIVAEFSRSVQAFRVRAVERIINVDVADVQPPPTAGDGSYLTAITQFNGELIQIIDVERLLAEVVGGTSEMSADLVERASSRASRTTRRVLIADDSRVARSQIEKLLQQLGLDYISVADGREALRYLQGQAELGGDINERLLMLISDVEMPDMDGYRLTTEIRHDPRLRGLHVLLHSSLSGRFNIAMAQKVGADQFLGKFKADELAKHIIDHLEAVII